MKTREEIYENLCKKAVFESRKRRAINEYFIISFSLLFLAVFIINFFKTIDAVFVYFFVFPYIPVGVFLVERGRSITNVSKKKIDKQLKIVFDEEIKDAKESNFSCEEKIRELEEMRAAL